MSIVFQIRLFKIIITLYKLKIEFIILKSNIVKTTFFKRDDFSLICYISLLNINYLGICDDFLNTEINHMSF